MSGFYLKKCKNLNLCLKFSNRKFWHSAWVLLIFSPSDIWWWFWPPSFSSSDSVEDELELSAVRHRPEGLQQLEAQTRFSRKELQILYRGFKNVSDTPSTCIMYSSKLWTSLFDIKIFVFLLIFLLIYSFTTDSTLVGRCFIQLSLLLVSITVQFLFCCCWGKDALLNHLHLPLHVVNVYQRVLKVLHVAQRVRNNWVMFQTSYTTIQVRLCPDQLHPEWGSGSHCGAWISNLGILRSSTDVLMNVKITANCIFSI